MCLRLLDSTVTRVGLVPLWNSQATFPADSLADLSWVGGTPLEETDGWEAPLRPVLRSTQGAW